MEKIIKVKAATASATSSALGASIATVTGTTYIYIAIAGAIIGAMAWFYDYANSEEEWTRKKSISEFIKYTILAFVTLPAAIVLSHMFFSQYDLTIPEVEIAIAALAAFSINYILVFTGEIVKGLVPVAIDYVRKILGVK